METELGTVHQGDCIEWMNSVDEPFADLVFADPPFNIGYQYDVYEDRMAYDQYHQWTHDWMEAVTEKVLKPDGTFWIAIGDEYAAEVRLIGRELGLTLRNWVIWFYTFGQNTKAKFSRSHAHLFYFVKDPKGFTFNDMAVRTFSDRQRVYRDKRANKDGRIPDDTWSEFPRLCGTFAEREGWHPCQMPLQVLTRIIRASSNVGDVVFDPFTGSGTTLVAAKRIGRRWCGTELSENYVGNIRRRLDETIPMAESRPAEGDWPSEHVQELQWLYAEASLSANTMAEQPVLAESFARQLARRLSYSADERSYSADEVLAKLQMLAGSNDLPIIKVHEKPENVGRPRKVRRTRRRRTPKESKTAGGLFSGK